MHPVQRPFECSKIRAAATEECPKRMSLSRHRWASVNRHLEPGCGVATQPPHVAGIGIALEAKEHDQRVQIHETRFGQRPVDHRTVGPTVRTDPSERRQDGAGSV